MRVRTGCARELVIAGRPAGFAFIVDAMEGNRSYKREMIEFVRERFPELKSADEGAVLGLAQDQGPLKETYFTMPRSFKTAGDVSSTASSWWQAPQSWVIVFFSGVAWLSSWQRKHPVASVWPRLFA